MNRKQVNTKLAWQAGLANELRRLEDNLEHLYECVGVSAGNRILEKSSDKEDDGVNVGESFSDQTEKQFEHVINEYLLSINSAAKNISSMVSEQTEFDLPIPVHVILRLAGKISLLRWKDYKKRPNELIKEYIYSLTPHLMSISLELVQTLVDNLGTNIIPYTPIVNQNLMRCLEWTRSSNLLKHDESSYHTLRIKLYHKFILTLERLSLNTNLEPEFLKTLVETDLIESLGNELNHSRPRSDLPELRDEHILHALTCLERLAVVHASGYFEPTTENKLRVYVTKSCIELYRDSKPNVMLNVACRRQLLQLLITISNMPFATSTSEIAYNILEQAKRIESDPDIVSLLYRTIRLGLAHRPTIVTHYDVYECFGRPMLTQSSSHITANGHSEQQQQQQDDSVVAVEVEKEEQQQLQLQQPLLST